MARKKIGRFGDSDLIHEARARYMAQDARRLARIIRSNLRGPPNCDAAARLMPVLMQDAAQLFANQIARHRSPAIHKKMQKFRTLYATFVKKCVRKTSTRARSQWRTTT